MKSRITACVSEELWHEASERLESRFSQLKNLLKCDSWHCYGDGVPTAPCTPQLWHKYIASEHDEHTSYFRHSFMKVDDKVKPRPFSHLALMPLVRSCVYQTLLAEFVTDRLAGKDAVRLRVEDELEHYSNLKSSETRHKIGALAQDFFGLIKNHLNATDKPLNRAGLASAEKMVVNLPGGVDYRSKRKGWSNRKLRQILADNIVNEGVEKLSSRKEQEAFVFRYLSADDQLKQSAVKAVLKLLLKRCDKDGVCVLKPWSKEELSEIRKEAREKGSVAKTMEKANVISEKLKNGEKLTDTERKFYYRHRDFFDKERESKVGTNQKSKCKRINVTKGILICPKQKETKIKKSTLSSIENVTADRFDLSRNQKEKRP